MKWFRQLSIKPWLLLLPSIIVIGSLAGYGIINAVVESLRNWDTGEWTTQYYATLFTDDTFWNSLFHSLYIAIISTAAALFIGLLVTRILYRYFIRNSWKALIWLPMLIPHFVAAYLVILFLSESGLLSSLVFHMGWIKEIEDFPFSVQSQYGTGIILTYVWKEVPFVILMLLPVYYQFNNDYEAVIRTLGGGRWEVFKTAEWPALLPVIMETGLILLAFTMAAFEVPYVLGVTYPKMLPILSYQWFFEHDWSSRPLSMAVMTTTTFFIFILSFAAFWLSQKWRLNLSRGK